MIKACEKCFENITGDGKYVFRCGKCKSIFRDDSEDATLCSSCINLIKSRRKMTCIICGETFIRKVYCRKEICPECKENLPGEGKCILTCGKCGGIFRGISSGVIICPSCDEQNRTLTCLLCGNTYIAEKGTRIDRVNTPICPDCDNDLPGEGRNILTCQRCGCLFKGNGGRCRTCPVCLNTIPKNVSVERYEKLIESGWKEDEKNGVIIKGIPEEKKGETECITCHRKFKRLNSKQLFCKHCCHVFTCVCCGRCRTCPVCLNTIPKNVSVERYEKLIESGWKEDEKNGVIIKGIPEEKKGETECITCHRKFKRLNSKQLFCKHCCHVFTCVCCGRRFAVKYVKFGYKPQYCGLECSNNSKIPTNSVDININDIDINIDEVMSSVEIMGKDINESMGKPGVWGLYDENGNLLDVAQTTNITNEWNKINYKFSNGKFINMRNDGIDLTKVSGKVIVFEDDLVRRLMVEEAFAIKYGAKYWHPQPFTFQMKIMSKSNGYNSDS